MQGKGMEGVKEQSKQEEIGTEKKVLRRVSEESRQEGGVDEKE